MACACRARLAFQSDTLCDEVVITGQSVVTDPAGHRQRVRQSSGSSCWFGIGAMMADIIDEMSLAGELVEAEARPAA
jgi:hypothetical protein